MSTNRFLTLVNGVRQLVTAIATSAGAGDANKIVATGSSGTIHPSLKGTGFSSIPPGMEPYYFVNATGTYGDRSIITLPEQTTLPVAPPTADRIRLYAADESGYPALNYLLPNGFQFRIGSDSYRFVRNDTGATLTRGTIVYITGSFAGTGTLPTVGKACAAYQASSLTIPAVGAVVLDIPNNNVGIILTQGKLENIDTASSGVLDGKVALLGMIPGTFQATAPALPNEIQRIGIVLRSHATQGVLLVDPATIISRDSGTNKNSYSIGDAVAGAKSLTFLSNFTSTITTTPTANRTIVLPDSSGTIALTQNSGSISLSSSAENSVNLNFQTAESLRWAIGRVGGAESGSNAGSNFSFNRYDDLGAFLGTPLSINRNNGASLFESSASASGINSVCSFLKSASTGTPANGIGGRFLLRSQNTDSTVVDCAYINWSLPTATAGAHIARLSFSIFDSAAPATGREAIRIEANNTAQPAITVFGTITTPGLILNATGAIATTGAGNGSISGNARGVGAADLQTNRSAATQVASGQYSFVAGINNTASASNSVALGIGNTSSGATSFSANNANTAAASHSAVFGNGNTATSTAISSFVTGQGNSCDRGSCVVTGAAAATRFSGSVTHASGGFVNFDSQTHMLLLRGTTLDAALTELTTPSRLVIPQLKTFVFTLLIVARRFDATDESAGWKIEGLIDRNSLASSTALVGSVSKTLFARDNATWDVTVDADNINASLRIRVTGEAAKEIRWTVYGRLVECGG